MFSQLGLSPTVCSSLSKLGFETPTPIQTAAIPLVMSGVDLLARAQTGTGKTAAFGLPMIEHLLARPVTGVSRRPRALVLVPTRELAGQVHSALATYGAPAHIRVTAIFGGVPMGAQIQALRNVDIIVATPGRLIDHMQRRTVDLSGIEVLTLDEADRMLDMGFLPALRRLAAALPKKRQTLLFSATLPDGVVRLSADFTRNPSRVDVSGESVVADTVTHHLHFSGVDEKRDVLSRVLVQSGEQQALVFCKTKRGANRVGDDLVRRGVKAGIIHGNKGQGARTRALADFKAGHLRVLVATDIAARGLDIEQLPLVVNFDLPLVAEDYVHRIGRTGRAGHRGRAVSLVTPSDSGLLREIERLVSAPLERLAIPGVAATPARPAFERPRPTGQRPPSGGSSRFGQRHPARSTHAGRPHSLATGR